MGVIAALDSGPLSLAAKARGKPGREEIRAWITGMARSGATIVVPEIAYYEVRRELKRCGATAGLLRLDELILGVRYVPITTSAIRLASDLWAEVRQRGLPTASPEALDGDCIVAAQSMLAASPGDAIYVVTDNPGHLERFPGVIAKPWDQIQP